MAKIPRVTQPIFASAATNNGVFGSAQDGSKILSASLATLMEKPAWAQGWLDAIIGASKFPPLEEFQALSYIETTQLAYLFQEGIPEYDAGTTYFSHSIVKAPGTFQLYGSLIDNNIGNALNVGADWLFLGDLSSLAQNFSAQGQYKDISGTWNSTTTATWTAALIILQDGGGVSFPLKNFNHALNITTMGAGGLDTGALASNTWYYVYAIYNPTTQTSATLISVSTAPTLPAGYTLFAPISSIYLDSGTHIRGFLQVNDTFQHLVGSNLANAPILASGSVGNTTTPSWSGASVSSAVAPRAKSIKLSLFGLFAGPEVMAAPNTSYGAYSNSANPPPMMLANTSGSSTGNSIPGEFLLESSNVYYASNGGSGSALICTGWRGF